MKYFCSLLFFLFYSTISLADKNIHIQIVDPDVNSTELEKEYTVSRKIETKKILPKKEDRDFLLSNFYPAKNWDELQKDIFYQDLKTKSEKDLQKKYPQISLRDILTLKGKIK